MIEQIRASFQGFFDVEFILSEAEGRLRMTFLMADSRNGYSEDQWSSPVSELASEDENRCRPPHLRLSWSIKVELQFSSLLGINTIYPNPVDEDS
ncbi:MAG: hypothetical protein A2Z14_00305 [Chloroflexi bacterium RBG_16_48_8]|nr:MAG: hypothetical protein A2Z14_00305 [Chloroflexi bacterium RBG_16_48_8]